MLKLMGSWQFAAYLEVLVRMDLSCCTLVRTRQHVHCSDTWVTAFVQVLLMRMGSRQFGTYLEVLVGMDLSCCTSN